MLRNPTNKSPRKCSYLGGISIQKIHHPSHPQRSFSFLFQRPTVRYQWPRKRSFNCICVLVHPEVVLVPILYHLSHFICLIFRSFLGSCRPPKLAPLSSQPSAAPLLLYEELEAYRRLNPSHNQNHSITSLSETTSDQSEDYTIPTPIITMFRIDFKSCGFYNGKDILVTKQLKKLDWKLEGYIVDGSIPLHRYIQAFELLLTEDVYNQVETYPQTIQILDLDKSKDKSIIPFRSLLYTRFPIKSIEVSLISFNIKLLKLKQYKESLIAYYKRLTILIQYIKIRDRPFKIIEVISTLSILEVAILKSIIKAFLRGLSNPDIRCKAIRGLILPNRSLLGIYNLVDEARRIKLVVQKLNDKER